MNYLDMAYAVVNKVTGGFRLDPAGQLIAFFSADQAHAWLDQHKDSHYVVAPVFLSGTVRPNIASKEIA